MMKMAKSVEYGDSQYDIWLGDEQEYGCYLQQNDDIKIQNVVQQAVDTKTIEQSYMIKFNITAGNTFENESQD